MKKSDISISICVPTFNEQATLKTAAEDLLSTLSASVTNLEVIIVDDGSKDLSGQLAQKLSNEHNQVKFIQHKKNLGIGRCFRDALAVAKGDYFTWFPSDHENSAQELFRCLPYLKDDRIVISHHNNHDSRSRIRCWLSRFYTWSLNKYFRMNLKYYNGLTVIPTQVLRLAPLAAEGFAFSAECIIYVVRAGCKVIELVAPLKGRASGKSKAFKISSLYKTCKDLFHILVKRRKSFVPEKQ